MKTVVVILAVVIVALGNFYNGVGIHKKNVASGSNYSTKTIDSKKYFVPYTWQTPWFKKDLNYRLKLNSGEGC